MLTLRYWLRAFIEDPRWPLCQICRWRPLLADDIGWFTIYPRGDERHTVCRHCLQHGPEAEAHVARYGVGER